MAAALSLLTGRALPYVLAGLLALAGGAYVWWQSSIIDSLRGRLTAAQERAEAAESANALLAAEMDRQAAERARNEAALRRERDAAVERAAARGRAVQEIERAPDASAPFSPDVGNALRRLYRDIGSSDRNAAD